MKRRNQYLDCFPSGLYERMPKAVLAALVVSYATRCGDGDLDDLSPETVGTAILDEWRILHQAGIVPQPPAKPRARSYVRRGFGRILDSGGGA